MTVINSVSNVTYQGNGSTTVWPFSFYIPDNDSLVVKVTNNLTNPATVTVLVPAQFQVAGLGEPEGGSVTYPLDGSTLPSSSSINIARIVSYTQPASFSNVGPFHAQTMEGALDWLEYQIQQLVASTQGGGGNLLISSLLDALGNAQGTTIYRGGAAWAGLPPGAKGQQYISGGPNANPSWGNPRGLHYYDYYQKYGSHQSALTHAVFDLYNTDAEYLDGDGIVCQLTSNFDVAAAAQKVGVDYAYPKGIKGFTFRCDPTWPQPSFATIFGGIVDQSSPIIISIPDTSALVVGQIVEHRLIPRYSTIASKTASSITLQNQFWSPNPTKSAGIQYVGDTHTSLIIDNMVPIVNKLLSGMTVAGSGIQANTKIDQLLLTFTMASAATATANGIKVTISTLTGPNAANYVCSGDTVNGSTTLTVYCDDSRLLVNGMVANAAGIPSNVVLSARTAKAVRLTLPTTSSLVGTALVFGTAPTDLRALNYFTGTSVANSKVVTGVNSTVGLKVGMIIDGYQCPRANYIESIDSPTQVTLSRPIMAGAVGKVFNFRDDSYLLDFTNFNSLEMLTVWDCIFDGNDVGNGMRMCQYQNPCRIHHNWYVDHVYWGLNNWSRNSGGFTAEDNRFYGSNANYNGNGFSRMASHIATHGSDGKILLNQGQGFLHGILVSDGAFIIGNHFWNTGEVEGYVQQDDGRVHWLMNYVDTKMVLTNECNVAAGGGNNGIGNSNIVGAFLNTVGIPPPVNIVVVRPMAPNTPLYHINVSNNLGKDLGNVSVWGSITGVETLSGDLDYSNFTAVYATNNHGPGLIVHQNPLRVRQHITAGSPPYVIDLTGLFPFNGQPNFMIGGVAVMNSNNVANSVVQNVTINRAARTVSVTTVGAFTGDICLELNCNNQASPPQAVSTNTFVDSQ